MDPRVGLDIVYNHLTMIFFFYISYYYISILYMSLTDYSSPLSDSISIFDDHW